MGFLSQAVSSWHHPRLLLHPSALWQGLGGLSATSHLCLLQGSSFLQPPAWQVLNHRNISACGVLSEELTIPVLAVPKMLTPKVREMNLN